MKIQVTVGEVDLSSIIGEHRVYDPSDDEYAREPFTVADAIVKELTERIVKTDSYNSLRTRVRDAREEVIREQLEPMVAAAIAEPIQPTNAFGESTGQPTTLRSMVIDQVRAYLKQNTGSYPRESTVVKDFIKAEVEKAIKGELAELLAEEKAKVVAAVRASAATLIADAVKQGIGGR